MATMSLPKTLFLMKMLSYCTQCFEDNSQQAEGREDRWEKFSFVFESSREFSYIAFVLYIDFNTSVYFKISIYFPIWKLRHKLCHNLLIYGLMNTLLLIDFPSFPHFISKIRIALIAQSCQLFVTPWTLWALQAPLSMEFSRQKYWSG